MPKIRHRFNGGLAEVDEAYAERLIAQGEWVLADTKTAPARKGRRGAQRPTGDTNTGE